MYVDLSGHGFAKPSHGIKQGSRSTHQVVVSEMQTCLSDDISVFYVGR